MKPVFQANKILLGLYLAATLWVLTHGRAITDPAPTELDTVEDLALRSESTETDTSPGVVKVDTGGSDEDDACPHDGNLSPPPPPPPGTDDQPVLPGSACMLPETPLTKRTCMTLTGLSSKGQYWKVSVNTDSTYGDILYLQCSDQQYYPAALSMVENYASIYRFQDGAKRSGVGFEGQDSDGGDIYFVLHKDGQGKGELVKSITRDPQSGKNIWTRPVLVSGSSGGAGSSTGSGGGGGYGGGGGRDDGQGSSSSGKGKEVAVTVGRWGKFSPDGLGLTPVVGSGSVMLWDDTTGDGIVNGYDTTGVALTYKWMAKVRSRIDWPERVAVFYTDQGNREAMAYYVTNFLGGLGYSYFDVFGTDTPTRMGGRTDGLYPKWPRKTPWAQKRPYMFMGIYRGSRAVAQENRGPDVYVVLQRDVGDGRIRNIFDPVELVRDPNSDTPGVGQVWAWIELPVLMRNPYVRRIWAIQQNADGSWFKECQWDADDPNARSPSSVPLMSLDNILTVPQLPGTKH